MATSSMTSVPKPLKLLQEYFSKLEESYEKIEFAHSQLVLSDILSVLAVSMDDPENKCLKYRLLGSKEQVSSFGHPYIRYELIRFLCVCLQFQ